ncbi:putative Mitochondrial carrier protein, partial [Paragonimus heterotremus]
IGGTVGAVVTCPLEVVKVRLQSSQGSALRSHSVPVQPNPVSAASDVGSSRHDAPFVRHVVSCTSSLSKTYLPQPHCPLTGSELGNSQRPLLSSSTYQVSMTTFVDTKQNPTPSGTHSGLRRSVLLRCLMDIGRSEGYRSLFKGLLPTLVGVLPSRGVYFCAYHKGQVFFEGHFPAGSSGVYLCAAGFGSIVASSLTNPIWFVKTRLQLDSRPGLPPITVGQVIRSTWRQDGFRGFYRGVSASYVGSLETALNFMIYENVKAKLLWWDRRRQHQKQQQFNVATASSRHPEPAATSSHVPHVPSSSPPSSTTVADLRGSKGGSKLNASSDMVLCMLASAFSKAVAITATYPHGK